MSLEIYGLDLRLAKKMLFTGVNLRIDKPNLVVYVIDEAGLFIEGADVNILSAGHELDSVTDALGTALTRFMPAINNTLTVSKDGYATSTQIIYNETPSTLSVYVQLYASEIRLKVVNNQNEPIEGATCRVLNAIGGSNNVLSFDGVDDYVNIPHNSLLTTINDFTLECWVYPSSLTGYLSFICKTNGAYPGPYDWRTNNNNGVITILIGGTTFRTVDGPTLTLNEWQHIAVRKEGWVISHFKNGVKTHSSTVSAVTMNDLGADIKIGTRNDLFTKMKGLMAENRIWNNALTDADILANYSKRMIGNESNLAGYWKLDEGTGSTATDSAGSNNGTIFGATWAEADESFPLFGPTGLYYTDVYDTGTTNANGLTTLNYQINTLHGLEVTLPGKRRFIMPFERTTRGLLDWQVMLSDYLATFATDRGNILINSEPENNDANFLIE